MKHLIVILLVIFTCSLAEAQQNSMVISYGDVTTDIEDANVEATGWRADIVFQMKKPGGMFIHGLGLGYIDTDAEVTAVTTTKYKLRTIPMYYQPKLQFGKKAFKGFLKGVLGVHRSEYERSGGLGDVSAIDYGFLVGASAGAGIEIKKKFLISLEYEWDYLSNSYYRDGSMQSIILGLGIRM